MQNGRAAQMKVTADNLAQVLQGILDEYAEDAEKTLDDAAKEAAKAGAKAIQNSAKTQFGGSGDYARGWTAQKEDVARHATLWKVWNKNAPGLPHLLEFGHALRNGGRSTPRVHIAPVEAELVQNFEKVIRERL